MALIPLNDASRRPTRFPILTASIVVVNCLVFLFELLGGEAFVTKWSVIPADIVAGHHWITILTAMFMHGSWSHIIANMVFLWAFGPEVEDLMGSMAVLGLLPSGWAGCCVASSGRSRFHGSEPRHKWRDCRRDGCIPGHLPS